MKTYTNDAPLPRILRRAEYAEYLASPRWKRLRAQCKRRAGDWCEGENCENLGSEAHHVSYRHRGGDFDSELADLRWLCRSCHRKAHKTKEAK